MPDRIQQVAGAVLAMLSAPLLAALALLIRIDSTGPAIYRAPRIGEGGRPFVCLKLRTMREGRSGADPAVSRRRDPRVTRVGRLLRSVRLDELPQLWNVARGEMRLVGPRPEDPRFVDLSLPLHREVFTVRPGIAGLTQLVYAGEGELLQRADDPEHLYTEKILPEKLRIDAAYLRHRSSALDLWILAQTPRAVLGRSIQLPPAIRTELEVGGGQDTDGELPAPSANGANGANRRARADDERIEASREPSHA